MIGFGRDGEVVVARFGAAEADALRAAASQMIDLLGADAEDPSSAGIGDPFAQLASLDGPPPSPPADPALARLFPDAYGDDADASAQVRRLTEDALKAGKVRRMRLLYDGLPPGGGRVRLAATEADGWLRALTDLRLAVAVRLDIVDDESAEKRLDEAIRSPEPAVAGTAAIYHYAGLLSETLVAALSGE